MYKDKLWQNTEELVKMRDRCTKAEQRNESLLTRISKLEILNNVVGNNVTSNKMALSRTQSQPVAKQNFPRKAAAHGTDLVGKLGMIAFRSKLLV